MESIIQRRINAGQDFLARYRRAYLITVCRESGLPVDLHSAALREARELIELAESLLPPDPLAPAK